MNDAHPLGTPAPMPPVNSLEEDARARISSLEREAKALGMEPAAALLFHEIGLLWEDPLKNPRSAAVAYQSAFKVAPRFVSNIRAARRLFADVGNWLMAVQLIDAELAAAADDRGRAALLLEKAAILEERLSRDEEAAKAYQECIALKPTDAPLLFQLEAVFSAKADHLTLVTLYRLLASSLKDGSLRAYYLTAAGLLLESRLNRPQEAAEAFREAFGLDRKNPMLLSAIIRVAEREDRFEELLEALAAEADILGPQAAPTYLRISKVYDRLGRRQDALAALLAARGVNPKEPLVLAELAQIYEAEGRFEALADVLTAWLESVSDVGETVAINLRLAALYEEELKRDPEAIKRYQALLQQVPGQPAALAGLGKLYYRTQNWEGLVQTYDAEIASLSDPKQQAARMFKAAEILEERLARPEDAISRYGRCLMLQPGYLPAQKALARLFEKASRYADLVAMYEQDLQQTTDREQSVAALSRIALLYEERLNDIDHAIDALRRILELVPDHLATMQNLARLLQRAGRWAELIALHESEAAMVGDTKQVLSLHHRNAEILEEHLKDRAGAAAAYERVLQLSPSYLPALKALGRLYAQDARWADLIRMYRAEAEISASTDTAAALIFKIGEIYETKLKSESEAIASYQEVLTLAPQHFPALRALARIYRAQSAWESLIDVLRSEAANRSEPADRANALFQAAAIWEDHLSRVDMAVAGYQEVLQLTPGHAPATRALERLFASANDLKELVTVIDRETQTGHTAGQRVAAFLKLGHLYLDRLNDPGRAAACADGALALEAGNLPALKVLERVRATDRVRRAEVRRRLAESVSDARLKIALRLTAAGDQDPGAEAMLQDLKAAVAENPGDPRLTLACERALRQAGDWIGLVALLRARRQALPDPIERLELTLRIAEVAEDRLRDPPQAQEAYREALAASPHLILALQGLHRTSAALNQWAVAKDALELQGKHARDVRTAVAAYVAAGRICAEKLASPDGAVACFKLALERDPLDPEAGRGIEEILAQRGGAGDLAALQERRAETKVAQKELQAAATDFYQAARTYLDKLNDRPHAQALVDRALAAQPTHRESLELKGMLANDAGQYADAAAAYGLRIQQGGDPLSLAGLHLTLGGIYQDHLNDLTRAGAHLQTALAADPNNVAALERLASIHTVSRNWTGAADCLMRLLQVEPNPAAQAKHTLALARLYDEGRGSPADAATLYKRALDLAPGDPAVLSRLVESYQRAGKLPELAATLEMQASRAADPAQALALRLKVADIHQQTQNIAAAVASYRQALSLDPTYAPAHVALAELYARDPATGPLAIDEHRALLRLDFTRADSLHALFKAWESLKQNDKAFCAASVLSFFRAANDYEAAFCAEGKGRLPMEARGPLEPADLEALIHPSARGSVLIEVLRVVGDQLSKVFPPQLDRLGIDRKADRLKADDAVYKAIRTVAQALSVDAFDVYQARRGLVSLENTEPLAVCVGADVVRKFNAREQKFLIARAVFGVRNKTALLQNLSPAEVVDLFGNCVRIFHPQFSALGRPNEEASKQLRKALPRKALKALEVPANEIAQATTAFELPAVLAGLHASADRTGALLCADPASALSVLLKEDPSYSTIRPETTEPLMQMSKGRADVRELVTFCLSEEFFALRHKVGLSL